MQNQIEIDSRVCGGTPVIRGTRIPVSVVLDELAGGDSWATVLAGLPELNEENLRIALQFSSATIDQTERLN